MKDHIGGYLRRYAVPEAACAGRVQARYRNVLVVPMFDEDANRLWHVVPSAAAGLLVICVINAPEKARDSAAHRRCRETLKRLGGRAGEATLVPLRPGVDLLLIDRATEHLIPTRQGVGLARRIGADIALALIAAGSIENRRIYSTDADVELPEDYFVGASRDPDAVAWSFPFRHVSQIPALHEAGQLYEAHLRYYRDGLARAGSRYALHSLGSTLCVDAASYAKVRGFPRRAAGEDFYLLNKLAKLGRVSTPGTRPIRIEARASTRTPFGTGQSLARIPQDREQYESFHPEVFVRLKEALQRLHNGEVSADDPTSLALRDMGAVAALERIHRQYRSGAPRDRAVDDWFDALRTLQFLHRMRDARWPNQPLLETLRRTRGLTDVDLDALNTAWRHREAGLTSP